MVRLTELDDLLIDYYTNDKVFGVVLVGSSSHFYKDSNSDFDVEVIVDDDYYETIKDKKLLIRNSDTKLEILILSYSNFLSKIDSSLSINHWPYEKGIVLYDRNGQFKTIIEKIVSVDLNELSKRLKLSYFELLLLCSKIERIKNTGEFLNLKLASAQIGVIASKLLFLMHKKWPPIIYWTSQNMLYLEDVDSEFKLLIMEVLNKPTISNVNLLINAIESELLSCGFDFWCDKEKVISEISTDEYVVIREKYSFL